MNRQDYIDKSSEKAALIIAIFLTLIWVGGIATIYYLYPDVARQISYDQSLSALVAVGLFLPLILIWTAALLSRSLSGMHHETKVLRKSIERMDEMLKIQIVEESETRDRWIQSQLAQITAHMKKTSTDVADVAKTISESQGKITAPRNTTALPNKPFILTNKAQADLPLPSHTRKLDTPITIRELIKALNFPDNAKDTEGFRILQRAFSDRTTSKLLQSAQDVLTMLSEDGIYMDDLRIEQPEASAWRSFAKGARGKDVAALGMVRDRTALTLSRTRLKNDTAFREKALRFLTQFDNIISEFEITAEDGELTEMGKTRSATAFMLLGRVSGAFDAR